VPEIRRVYVANRGEIAVRIIRACQSLGIQTVLGVSEADRQTLGAQMADRTVCIGPASATRSYLSRDALITAALGTGCDAVHPGYGFLAENPEFARTVLDAGLIWVGPPPDVMETLVRHPWPGNVRELQHVIQRGVILSCGPSLQLPPLDTARPPAPRVETFDDNAREHILEVLRETHGVVAGARGAAARLGLKRSTLQWRMQKLGIHPRDVVG